MEDDQADAARAIDFRRSGRAWMLAGVLATVVLVVWIWGLWGLSPARDVSFDGSPDDAQFVSCHGPSYWTGSEAFTACHWVYRHRALVRLDPQTARAKVLHHWQSDDGNVPELALVVPCGQGRLFVIGETRQTTLVTVGEGGSEVSASVVHQPGRQIVGAGCRDGQPEVMVSELVEDRYVRLELEGGVKRERILRDPAQGGARLLRGDQVAQTWSRAQVGGAVFGAWLAADGWHTMVRETVMSDQLGYRWLAGRPGSPAQPIVPYGADVCLAGAPGGWLFRGWHGSCAGRQDLLTFEQGWQRISEGPKGREASVLTHSNQFLGQREINREHSKLLGLGPGDLELTEDALAFQAQRGDGPRMPIAKRAFASLHLGVQPLPMSDGQIAIWGGLGDELVVLDSDLRRLDALGPIARTLRPLGRFRSSSNSAFDQLCYLVLLLLSPLALIAVLWSKRRPQAFQGKWPRRLPWIYCLLFVIGISSVVRVAAWL